MRVLSLFSGIGGLDLAAEWAGMTTVAFCERDPYCQKVLAKHWPGVPIFDDVTTLKGDQVGTVGIIVGGYPCQPFSVAGKRKGKEDERYLWPEFMRLIRELEPAWVVGENVAGHITNGLDDVCDELEAEGYAVQSLVFPASAVGARHERERCFVVAHYSRMRRDSAAQQAVDAEAHRRKAGCGFDHSGQDVDNTNSPQRQRNECSERVIAEHANTSGAGWWSVEPAVGRVANGVPHRVDRLRALGNAVVPQQAYPIFKAIAEVSR